jgi:exodeoxyribonuclease VII small subunit
LGYALIIGRHPKGKVELGRSPGIIRLVPAGHSRRRTSGGRAGTYVAYDIRAGVSRGPANPCEIFLIKMKNEQPQSFEASLEGLEEIVQQLEGGDLPLEKSLELFEQGIKLSRQCQERLSQAERRIEVLLRDNQGRPVVSAFEDAKVNSGTGNSNDEDAF